jgi:hypothetical protein
MTASEKVTNAEYARRLVLEIGYYDESLPELILEIIAISEHLNIDLSIGYHGFRDDVKDRFFGGPIVALLTKGLFGFESNVRSADAEGEMWMPYLGGIRMGEKVLRVEIDGVKIPYESDYPSLTNLEDSAEASIALTGLDVNDTELKLDWKVTNNTIHDVWICDGYVDRFMDQDNQTLFLRRRYNLSDEGIRWEFPFPRFRYSRLRPGQEIVKSLSHTLPITPTTLFSSSQGNAESAKHLTVEVGFYNEDLSGLIIDIAEMAQKLTCDISLSSPLAISGMDPNDERTIELRRRFFGGPLIARAFYLESFDYFRNSVMSGGDEIIAPYLSGTLHGEQVLCIEVDNVAIPYKSNYPPLP